MSLFDRDDVAPPEPCSRCGHLVVRTSLFCPKCGQSRVNPLPKAAAPEPDETVESQREDESEEKQVEEDKPSTLSRTTDWIMRNIARVGQGGQPERAEEPTPGLSSEDSLEAEQRGGHTSSWPERLAQSSRVQTRFVLVAQDGRQFTLGQTLSGIGSAESAPEDEQMQWICVSAPDNSIDALHLRCGVEDGVFWVEDANSIMGTIISEAGRAPLQCIPFERYFVVRGSTIQLGSLPLTLQ